MSSDTQTHLKLQFQNELLKSSLRNDWKNNNGNLLNDVTLTNNQIELSNYLDIDGYEANSGSKLRCILIYGKCNLANESDNFSLVYTNTGANYYWGESIRPTINAFDNMYHFKFTLDSFSNSINIGNKCGSDITNFTLNYTYLK